MLYRMREITYDPRSIEERLRKARARLQSQFGVGVGEWNLDHDQDHLTSTDRRSVLSRKFFLGEVWWVERPAFGDYRPCLATSSHTPGLVTRREDRSTQPVEMAPLHPRGGRGGRGFVPESTAGLESGPGFALALRRPIAREEIGAPLATLNGKEKQRLSVEVEASRRAVARDG